jgi:hypothetical protein
MQKLVLNLHIYGGLLCFSYLIVFGVSSLAFNHESTFPRKGEVEPKTWERPIDLPDLPRLTESMTGEQRVATKAEANNRVRAALGLFGHQRPWEQSWWDPKDPNHYRASIVRPGREYEVDVYLDRKLARVTETRRTVWTILSGLHGFHGRMPGSQLVSSWTWYTELCTFVVLFAGASGIYLWTRRRNERRAGGIVLGIAMSMSLALILYITLHG